MTRKPDTDYSSGPELASLVEVAPGLSSAQTDQLQAYLRLLRKWNRTFNLTAIDAPERALTHHLFDSLSVLPHVRASRLLDVGSGAGLPGIPLAVARPDMRVTLLDSNGKKCAFLRQAVIELGLAGVEVVHARVETFTPAACFPQIISRAFSELAEFVRLTRHLLCAGGEWLAMKGALPAAEIASLQGARARAAIELAVPGLEANRHVILLEPT
jgi:16S rRNA (guanine527-N7)-methyltransferase